MDQKSPVVGLGESKERVTEGANERFELVSVTP